MEDRKWLIRVVATMWVLNLGAGMIPPLNYDPSEAVNGIFMLIVGSLFVANKTERPEKKHDGGSKEADQESA